MVVSKWEQLYHYLKKGSVGFVEIKFLQQEKLVGRFVVVLVLVVLYLRNIKIKKPLVAQVI